MGMKLGVHVYFIVSMTTTNKLFVSSLFKLTNGSMHEDEHVYVIVSMTTTYKNEWRQVNLKNLRIKKEENMGIV